ncbi:BtrH N-terminal domain-containing protein [Streptomyces sp. NPDC088115]|uniref:BtrH N-terminal domain-containing protein n=1 Tax=Streptomyces sp. NPDC088115 TaxID=3365824 RepID=UPI00382B7AC2
MGRADTGDTERARTRTPAARQPGLTYICPHHRDCSVNAPAGGSFVSWYDDLSSCLQMDIGYVLERAGWDPVQALGAGWRFSAPTGPVESVEYFHPAGDRIEEYFCLHHPVSLRWHSPRDAAAAHHDVVASLTRGVLPVVAVNNYHLPFRPAYHDVHAAHLLVVTGYEPEREVYRIVDPMPPAHRGDLPRSVLEEARSSLAVDDASDPFFAGSSPAWRWLEVRTTGPQPTLSLPWLREVVTDNVASMRGTGGAEGPAVLARLLDELPGRIRREGRRALQEIYVLGWPAQAETSLHSTFLTRAGLRFERPDLVEAARWVDLVAHSWTGLRVGSAHGAVADHPAEHRVTALGRRLLVHWEQSLQRLEDVLTHWEDKPKEV